MSLCVNMKRRWIKHELILCTSVPTIMWMTSDVCDQMTFTLLDFPLRECFQSWKSARCDITKSLDAFQSFIKEG